MAWKILPVGASSEHIYRTAGVTSDGARSGGGALTSIGGLPGTVAVIRVAAPGARQLMRILCDAPSSANTFMKPTIAVFAAP